MLYINVDGSIRLTRGDTARFSVKINNDISDNEYDIQDNDELKFSVKRKIKDETPCVQKSITGTNTFIIEPQDTDRLAFGSYVYDVQLTTAGGDVYTVIEPTLFEILTEVTC